MRKEKQRVITWARIWQAMRLERHLSQHYNIINSWLSLEPNRKDEAGNAYAASFRRLPREKLRSKLCSNEFFCGSLPCLSMLASFASWRSGPSCTWMNTSKLQSIVKFTLQGSKRNWDILYVAEYGIVLDQRIVCLQFPAPLKDISTAKRAVARNCLFETCSHIGWQNVLWNVDSVTLIFLFVCCISVEQFLLLNNNNYISRACGRKFLILFVIVVLAHKIYIHTSILGIWIGLYIHFPIYLNACVHVRIYEDSHACLCLFILNLYDKIQTVAIFWQNLFSFRTQHWYGWYWRYWQQYLLYFNVEFL